MTRNFDRWEVDPLFSAAEQVQDSADRLDSVYRNWMHIKSLSLSGKDERCLIEFRKRELSTTLGTAKWQLEEFEKAASTTQAQQHYHEEEDAPGRHKQFVFAIQNQIATIEKALLSSDDIRDASAFPIVKLGQDEKDDLEQFLSGSRNMKNSAEDMPNGNQLSSPKSMRRNFSTLERLTTSLSHSDESFKKSKQEQAPQQNTADATDYIQIKIDHRDEILSHSDSELLVKDHNLGEMHHRSISIGDHLSFFKGDSSTSSYKERGNVFTASNKAAGVFSLLSKVKFRLQASGSSFKRWKDGDALDDDQCRVICSSSNINEKWMLETQGPIDAPLKKEGRRQRAWSRTLHTLQCSQGLFSGKQPVRVASTILATFAILGLLSFNASTF